jgi:hypothetical protein
MSCTRRGNVRATNWSMMTRKGSTDVKRDIFHGEKLGKGIEELAEGGPFPVSAEAGNVLSHEVGGGGYRGFLVGFRVEEVCWTGCGATRHSGVWLQMGGSTGTLARRTAMAERYSGWG